MKIIRIILLIAVVCLLSGCKEGAIPSKILEKDKIVREFQDSKERFLDVSEYLRNIKENVFIEKREDNNYLIKRVDGNKIIDIVVEDKRVDSDIQYILCKLGFKYISEDGNNGIYFVRQTSMRFAQGLAYSKDGQKPDWGTIEVLEPIGGNWYYYKGY